MGNRIRVRSEAWAWPAGTRRRRWCFSADSGDCSIPAPNSPSRPLVAVEQADSAALASHQKKKKEEKEKVGEADAKRKINRDKREEGGVADQPFLFYGVPAGTAKEKKKKSPGVNASEESVCVCMCVSVERGGGRG